jgi:hypothetical protein
MRRKLVALGGAVVVALAACSGGSHQSTPTTLSPATGSPPPSATAAINPEVIPPVITVAYVNAVLAVLNHIYGNATRSLRSDHAVTPQVKADLRSIFNDPLYTEQVQTASESLRGPINNVRSNSGDGVTVVKTLISRNSSCIFVETTTTLAAVLVHVTPSPASEYYELAPKQPGDDPDGLNPTPWAFAFNVAYLTPTTVQDRCGE